MWIVLVVAIWSGLDYFWAFRRHMIPAEDEPAAAPPSEAAPKGTGRSD
jgi:hypothetical protein